MSVSAALVATIIHESWDNYSVRWPDGSLERGFTPLNSAKMHCTVRGFSYVVRRRKHKEVKVGKRNSVKQLQLHSSEENDRQSARKTAIQVSQVTALRQTRSRTEREARRKKSIMAAKRESSAPRKTRNESAVNASRQDTSLRRTRD